MPSIVFPIKELTAMAKTKYSASGYTLNTSASISSPVTDKRMGQQPTADDATSPTVSSLGPADVVSSTINTGSPTRTGTGSYSPTNGSLQQFCNSRARPSRCMVVIDGAHAPGVLDINLPAVGGSGGDDDALQCDIYTGNLHKWLFAPKGSAFMWTRRDKQTYLFPQPTVISSSMKYDYAGRFEYTGTRDYTAFATIPSAFRFVDDVLGGMQAMRTYNRNLLLAGSRLLVIKWKTFYVIPERMCGFMSNIALPVKYATHMNKLQKALMRRFNISIVCGSVPRTIQSPNSIDHAVSQRQQQQQQQQEEGEQEQELEQELEQNTEMICYTRLSAQVYLQISDYERLADAVLLLLNEFA